MPALHSVSLVFLSYYTVACCFQTGVIGDCPTWSTSPLLCALCHSEGSFRYNACFVITLILLGLQKSVITRFQCTF